MELMDPIYIIAIALVALVVAFYLGWLINSKIGKSTLANAEERVVRIISDAEKEAKNLKKEKILEVKDEWY
ncbi:MAG: DUF3552 domain-containing protein, partial [Melioribacteraceae bacterium]|nr:DUF3552 domain-containing protein [Melioribacteraceae bacterium]